MDKHTINYGIKINIKERRRERHRDNEGESLKINNFEMLDQATWKGVFLGVMCGLC